MTAPVISKKSVALLKNSVTKKSVAPLKKSVIQVPSSSKFKAAPKPAL